MRKSTHFSAVTAFAIINLTWFAMILTLYLAARVVICWFVSLKEAFEDRPMDLTYEELHDGSAG